MRPTAAGRAADDRRLHDHLALVSRVGRLLVATDFDGTLVGFEDDPDAVWLPEPAHDLLGRLARCPGTTVAVLSGRSLADLDRRLGGVPGLVRIGSHGAERSGAPLTLDAERARLLGAVTGRLREIAGRCPGAWVETKPASAVFHYRTADPSFVPGALEAVMQGPAAESGLHRRLGKDCVELAVSRSTKGLALADLRSEHRADRVVFLGDDVTDEDGFLVLAFQDVGIKVGPGDTVAEHRVDSPDAALAVLEELLLMRELHSSGSAAEHDAGVQSA